MGEHYFYISLSDLWDVNDLVALWESYERKEEKSAA